MAELNTPAQDLARAERKAGALLIDAPSRWLILTLAFAYLVFLLLPFAGNAAGWQFLAFTEASRDAKATLTEYLFTWASFLGLGVCGSLAAILRRYRLAAIGWVVTCMAVVFALMSIWLRRSSAADLPGHGLGIYLAMLAVLVAAFAYVPLVTRRGAEQEAIAVERAAAQEKDEIAEAQRFAAQRGHSHNPQENPLLVDDRRARATERHKR